MLTCSRCSDLSAGSLRVKITNSCFPPCWHTLKTPIFLSKEKILYEEDTLKSREPEEENKESSSSSSEEEEEAEEDEASESDAEKEAGNA